LVRVAVFFDYQNAYHCARDAFCDEDDATRKGNFWPKRMAQLLTEKGPAGPPRRELSFIGVYAGAPDPRRDQQGARAQSRRVAAWQRESGSLLTVKSRGLRYPPGRPLSEAEEKGIDVQLSIDAMVMGVRGEYDVAIIVSADTDLLPVVEGLLALKALNGKPDVEVVGWKGLSKGLNVSGVPVRWIGDRDFYTVRDHTDYNITSGSN
jgi:uncharacterized LabA/DUF88 family protein